MLTNEELEEIRNILKCVEIQIKKLEDAVDIADNKLSEIAVATDAIRFDFEELKKRINN